MDGMDVGLIFLRLFHSSLPIVVPPMFLIRVPMTRRMKNGQVRGHASTETQFYPNKE
jgi:hypothetical protein